MPLRLLIILSLALLAEMAARAQIETADGFFDSGAQLYISNNIPAALEKTETGLKLYPNDAKLKKLEELLKQQQQQQSQQNQQQQKNNQSKQNQQNHSQQQSQNKQQEQKKEQNQSQQQKQQQREQAEQKQAQQKTAPDHMTPEDARHLLDSQKENEQFLQLKPNVPPGSKEPTEDW